METGTKTALRGGEFIITQTAADQVFTPEDFTEEEHLIAGSCHDFLEAEVLPRLDEIDSQRHPALMPSLLEKCGELGLLGTSVPEEYGGFGMNFVTSMLVADVMGMGHSFAVAHGAHTGIGTLPILYYGNEEQKAKYLPKLATGEWKGAYCLTEPDSGSDANSGKTKAVLSEDGQTYLLTGQKMWITNGGFADVFTVFARIGDDPNLSAFIVERGFAGITMNEEEHKMGIKGSSTRQIFFNDCPVPAANLLGQRNEGFKIAVNILNIGRIKLAVAALGGARRALNLSIDYAGQRKQFGQTIGSFGAIQYKLAEQAARLYAAEAATYRAAQQIEDKIESLRAEGLEYAAARLKGVEQYAIECALLKVGASEVLDYVVDEAVQIYGGMGFSADAPVERGYRDSRINRIFEGTNEINRMLAVGTVLRRALKGELNLMQPAMAVAQELTGLPDMSELPEEFMAEEKRSLAQLKKLFLLVAGGAAQKLGTRLEEQQEVMMACADILIDIYLAESALLRTEKLASRKGAEAAALQADATRIYLYNAAERAGTAARLAINAYAEGDEQRLMLLGVKRFTKAAAFNSVQAHRRIAQHLLQAGRYDFWPIAR